MDESSHGLVENVARYSAASIGLRVLSSFVGGDLGVNSSSSSLSPSTSEKSVDKEDSGNGHLLSNSKPKVSNFISQDWLWGSRRSRSSSKQYSSAGFDAEYSLPLFTLEDVSLHDIQEDCWVVIYDRVYDITNFLNSHPGGDEVMMEYAGQDATLAFRSVGHSKEAEQSLKPYLVGILVENERIWTRFFNMKSDVP